MTITESPARCALARAQSDVAEARTRKGHVEVACETARAAVDAARRAIADVEATERGRSRGLALQLTDAISGGRASPALEADRSASSCRAQANADVETAEEVQRLLATELENAKANLAQSEVALRLATRAVLADDVDDLVRAGLAAEAELHRVHFALTAIERVGHTLTAHGLQRFPFPTDALRFLRFAPRLALRAPPVIAANTERWRQYRVDLESDVGAEQPR